MWRNLGFVGWEQIASFRRKSHASLPTAVVMTDGTVRVFFASRDEFSVSSIYSMDLQFRDDAFDVAAIRASPALEPGAPGYFDDSGVYPSSTLWDGGRLLLYYIGWVRGAKDPMFYANVGLAISEDNGISFRKYQDAPIFGRDSVDPWMTTAPTVTPVRDGFLMWYVGGGGWIQTANGATSTYFLRLATSSDGIYWTKKPENELGLLPGEKNISRMGILRTQSEWHSWFGVDEGFGYRLQHAVSKDGVQWTRSNREELFPPLEDWNRKMQSYPNLFSVNGRHYMLLNGDGFGRDGFGVSRWEGPSFGAF